MGLNISIAAQTWEAAAFNAFNVAIVLHSYHYSNTILMETEAFILNTVFQENQRNMRLCLINITNGRWDAHINKARSWGPSLEEWFPKQ